MARAAKATRNVTARDLSRQTARLLDEIECEGSALVVVRYGRPAAVLVPFEEVAMRPHLPRIDDLSAEITVWPRPESEDIDDVELDENQHRVVIEVNACTLLYWTPSQCDLPARDLSVALARLELSGLMARGPGASWHLTAKGERLVAGLDSRA